MRVGLVLAHGIAMHGDVYQETLDEMTPPGWLSVAIDMPGHGSEPGHLSNQSVSQLFARVASDLARSGVTTVVTAGESLGCAAVGAMTEQVKDCGLIVAGHVLFAPPFQLDLWTLLRWTTSMLTPPRGFGALRGQLDFSVALRDLVSDPVWRTKLLDDPEVKSDASVGYLIRSARQLLMLDSGLSRLAAPTLVLQGEMDPLMGGRNLELSLKAVGSAKKEAHLIPGAGHSLFWDPSTPIVTTLVREWLNELVGG